ncbi:hypothetical protein [Pyramidobacter piscolens]|uniref:hypothetical protein n=1 Tax=Pyramidobacter piscolens TaxID=638849 RepID=UPI0024929A40|nr:hypothetical protein [Pyramidobacter piscolens]
MTEYVNNPFLKKETQQQVDNAIKSNSYEKLASSGRSSEEIELEKYKFPLICRYLGSGDTLSVSIMGIIGILLVIVFSISIWCSDAEKMKTLLVPLTTVIGYLAGKKLP